MAGIRRYANVESVRETTEIDRLAVQVRQLVNHRGFDRGRVSSPLLKRFLPATTLARRTFTEDTARRLLVDAKLDAKSIAYLSQSVRDEIGAAHAALA